MLPNKLTRRGTVSSTCEIMTYVFYQGYTREHIQCHAESLRDSAAQGSVHVNVAAIGQANTNELAVKAGSVNI